MADTIGFEIDVEVLFSDASEPVVPYLRTDEAAFLVPEVDLEFGSTAPLSPLSVPSSPGFELEEPDVEFGVSLAGQGPVNPTQGFEFNATTRSYPGENTFEIILAEYPRLVNTQEEEVNLGDIRIDLIDGIGTLTSNGTDLSRDAGLESAMILSLFSDRRVNIEDVRAAGLLDSDLRGWWGDTLEEIPLGSRVWLLNRAKIIPKTSADFREYALEAWRWLIDDGVAKSIDATVEQYDMETLLLFGTVYKPDGAEDVNFKFYVNWKEQTVRRA